MARNQRLFDLAFRTSRSRLARYEVVHRFGGVYLDADVEYARPLDPLLRGVRDFLGARPVGDVGRFLWVRSLSLDRSGVRSRPAFPASCLVNPVEHLRVTSGPLLLGRTIRMAVGEPA